MKRAAQLDEPPLLISANLAKPLANPWRNRILMEVHLRPLSPKQFSELFGGPELATIARYFRELKAWGFLEIAEELRGGGRRGAVEKVYRAIQRIHFDTETWAQLPDYLRQECSGAVLDGLILRISDAVRAGTFDAEKDRHLSWKTLHFDRPAWSRYIDCLDEMLLWISDLEIESAQRAAETDQVLLPITIGLLAFRSPVLTTQGLAELTKKGVSTQDDPRYPPFLISPRTAKALANPWRNRILMELHLRPMSPKEFVNKFGGPDLATVARYFRQLKEWGYLEVSEERRGGSRRGGVEKVYRAIQRVHFHTTVWEQLPQRLRDECSGAVLDGLILRIDEAVRAETFDAELDRHLSWKAGALDRQGWVECVNRLDEILDFVYQLEAESSERLSLSSEPESIPATVALMAFRTP